MIAIFRLSIADSNYPTTTTMRLSTAASSNTTLLSQMVIEIFENFHSFVGFYVGLRRDHTTTALAEHGVRITPTCDDIPAYFAPFKTIGNEPAAPLARAS